MPDQVHAPARIADLAAWMRERHVIYLQREDGRFRPWSDDPIFRQWRFCNVFRELDTTTIWIRENIRERFANHPHLWFMLCIARYINRIESLRKLIEMADGTGPAAWPSKPGFYCGVQRPGQQFEGSDLTWALHQFAKEGPVYTGAYMIRAESDPSKEWYHWTKHRYIADIVLGRLWAARQEWAEFLDSATTLEEVWKEFQKPHYIGWGPFMAYEVVTDLRHTRYLRDAEDIWTWANAGPGALRGLNRLYGRPLKAPNRNAVREMMAIQGELNADPALWPKKDRWPGLEMRDVEHSLCEFDKYERVRLGEGKPRSRYAGV